MTSRRRSPGDADQAVTNSIVFGDVVQISRVSGNVTVAADRPMYQIEQFVHNAIPIDVEAARTRPSRLLLARHEVVPFTGRDSHLAQLQRWASNEDLVSVHLFHAAGGQGKTRLAGEFAARCVESNWAVWRITHASSPSAVSHVREPSENDEILALVDYADRWPSSHLFSMVEQLRSVSAHLGVRIRVLMLARSAGYWWDGLTDRLDSQYGITASASLLPALGAQIDRTTLYREAHAHFASVLGVHDANALPVHNLDLK